MAQLQETFLFTPTSVRNCVMWFDAAEASTVIRSGTNVTQWNDKTGNGNTAVAGTATYPVYKPNTLNGLPTISLQGANDYFLVSNNLTMTTYPSLCYFIVVNPSSSQPNTTYAGILSTDSPTQFGRTLALGGGSWQEEFYNGFNNITAYTANTWALVSLQFVGTVSVTLAVNGTTFAGTATATGNNTTGFKIGTYNSDGGYATYNGNFDIGEVLVYGSALSTTERQQIEGYLAWKWGLQGSLPSNHPFKNYRTLANPPVPSVGIPFMPIRTQETQPFVPMQISGCQLWLDATDTNTLILSEGNVSQWNDKSGNGYSVGQVSSGKRPALSASPQGIVLSGGVALTQTATNIPLIQNATALTIFSIVTVPSTVENNNVITFWFDSIDSVSPAASSKFYIQLNSTNNELLSWNVSGLAISSNSVPINRSAIVGAIFSSTTASTNINGTLTSVSGGPLIPASADALFTLGYPNYQDNILSEVILYNAALTVDQRQQVEGYLAWKWNLTSSLPPGHPFKTQPLIPFPYRAIPFTGCQTSWQPTQISSCQLWLDAADSLTLLLSGTTVTQWNDKSGNGRNTSTLFSAPTFSNRAVRFNNQGLSVNLSASTNVESGFFVAGFTNQTQGNTLIGSGTGEGGRQFRVTSSVIQTLKQNITGVLFTGAAIPSGTTVLVNYVNTGSLLTHYWDGSFYASGAAIAYDAGLTSSIGQRFGNYPTEALNGYIQEVIIYNTPLTTPQRQQVEGYLAWKWGLVSSLPATHPYKLFPPSP